MASPYKLDAAGHLARNLEFGGKAELVDALHWWLTNSRAGTVGDIKHGKFKGRPWLWATIAGHRIHINADTTRAAVQWVVGEVRRRPDAPWRVVRNQRGAINKVIVGRTSTALLAQLLFRRDPYRGWYAYTKAPLREETLL